MSEVKSIQLNSVEDGESFGYPLVRLVGQAEGHQGKGSIVATCAGETVTWPLVDEHFKVLVLLTKGRNDITLQIQGQKLSKNISLEYNPEMFPCTHTVRLVYWVATGEDGSFHAPDGVDNSLESAMNRLRTAAMMMQTFCAENLKYHGMGSSTFTLEMEDEACRRPKVHIINSRLTRDEMRAAWKKQGDIFLHRKMGQDAKAIIDDDTKKMIGLISFTEFDQVTKKSVMHTALGGDRHGAFGTNNLYTWAENYTKIPEAFMDDTPINKEEFADDSFGRGNRWGSFATGMGATLHEIGHALGLPHVDIQTTGDCVMNRGYDWINRFYLAEERNRNGPTSNPEQDGVLWCRGNATWLRFSPFFTKKRVEVERTIADLPTITPMTVPSASVLPSSLVKPTTTPGSQAEIWSFNANNSRWSHIGSVAGMPLPTNGDASRALMGNMQIGDNQLNVHKPRTITLKIRYQMTKTDGNAFELIHEGGEGIPRTWFELTPDGSHHATFEEIKREGENVELYDAGREVYLKLANVGVYFRSNSTQTWRGLSRGRWDDGAANPEKWLSKMPAVCKFVQSPTDIQSLITPDSIQVTDTTTEYRRKKGGMTRFDMNNKGYFIVSPKENESLVWYEMSAEDKVKWTFAEVRRQEAPKSSVVLYDASRKISIKIRPIGAFFKFDNSEVKQWRYLGPGKWEQEDPLELDQKTHFEMDNGRHVKIVQRSASGQHVWHEISDAGRLEHTFVEVKRDQNGFVEIYDVSRNFSLKMNNEAAYFSPDKE
eukprot:Ihof_evm2s661 gene=Ihof_evmTU2s661